MILFSVFLSSNVKSSIIALFKSLGSNFCSPLPYSLQLSSNISLAMSVNRYANNTSILILSNKLFWTGYTQWKVVRLNMFASFLMNFNPLLLKTETQIGDGGRFSKEYQGVLLAVRYFLSIPVFLQSQCILKHFHPLSRLRLINMFVYRF